MSRKTNLPMTKVELFYYDEEENTFKPMELMGNKFQEYRILSTDTMPEAKEEEKGAMLLVMDTGDVYFNHGGTWGVY